jgi:outer membrane cobalamin receptor
MKRTVLLIFVMNVLFLAYSNSQDVIESGDSPVNPEYLTWRDLITGYDIQSLKDLYQAYINCDFERESMKDIKLALEQKKLEYEKIIQGYDTEYLAKIRNMDIIINVPEKPHMIVQNAE